MPNLPNNQIVLDQSDRGTYAREYIETWETGAHVWRSLVKDNPSYFHAIPHKDGMFSTAEYQANGHNTSIIDSSRSTQQDSSSDGTTQNRQTQTGGGVRSVNGQGSHEEHGKDSTSAVNGSKIAISKDSNTNMSKENGHNGVKGDYGFYVKGGGYSVASEKQMAFTSQKTIHMEAESEMSLKGKKNAGMTSQGKVTLDAKGEMTANSGGNMTIQSGATIEQKGQTINITGQSEIKLTVGGSYIKITGGNIELKSGEVKVNNSQQTATSNIFV